MGTNLVIRAGKLVVSNKSSIQTVNSSADSMQKGGELSVQAGEIDVTTASKIVSDDKGAGPGGDLTIQADSLNVNGYNPNVGSSKIGSVTEASGSAGDVIIQVTGNVNILNRGNIGLSAAGGATGNGGQPDFDCWIDDDRRDDPRGNCSTDRCFCQHTQRFYWQRR